MENKILNLGKKITKELSNSVKKNEGIFFTPIEIIKENITFLKSLNKNFRNILEPSCGSCFFIDELDKTFLNLEIDCIEKNNFIFEKIKNLEFNNKVNFFNKDFLNFNSNRKYDLIIGNPPYFVMNKKDILQYKEFISGRPNIFILFILHSLTLLKDDGLLSFILPSNFLNCCWYNNIRKYINDNFTILKIIIHKNGKYIDTLQQTISFIIQKRKGNNDKFILIRNDIINFNSIDNIEKIKNLIENSTTLNELKCNVSIGSVVWNQEINNLTDNNTDSILIYSTDIKNQQIVYQKYKNTLKKRFIKNHNKIYNEKIIVINRGYGSGKYNFSFCLIDNLKNFTIENHLIIISNFNEEIQNKILKSFNNKKTLEFINLYFNNGAINVNELKNILPIY